MTFNTLRKSVKLIRNKMIFQTCIYVIFSQEKIEMNNHLTWLQITLVADRLSEDAYSNDDGDVPDEFLLDGNNMEMNRVLDNLREEIKFDENIAMKSAMLLKLLEVSIIWNSLENKSQYRCTSFTMKKMLQLNCICIIYSTLVEAYMAVIYAMHLFLLKFSLKFV